MSNNDRHRSHGGRPPDNPAGQQDATMFSHAFKSVLVAIRDARRVVQSARPSPNAQDAHDVLDRCYKLLDDFIRAQA
jgi:hypothetical protein